METEFRRKLQALTPEEFHEMLLRAGSFLVPTVGQARTVEILNSLAAMPREAVIDGIVTFARTSPQIYELLQ